MIGDNDSRGLSPHHTRMFNLGGAPVTMDFDQSVGNGIEESIKQEINESNNYTNPFNQQPQHGHIVQSQYTIEEEISQYQETPQVGPQ